MSIVEASCQSEREADRVEFCIKRDAPGLSFERVQLGNLEWVIKVTKGPLFIWSEEDWEKKKNESDIIAKRLIA